MKRRQVLLGSAALLGSAGCVTNDAGTPDTTDTPTESDATETVPDPGELDDVPGYDNELRLTNAGSETRTVAVRVSHVDTGDVVHSGSHDVDPGEELRIFDFSELAAEYEGVESFEIRAESGDDSGSVTFRTSRCHGLPEILVSDEGVTATYAVC